MKFATFSEGNLQRVGVIVGNESGLVDLLRHVPDAPREMIELMSRWSDFRPKVERAASHPADFPLTAVKLHAPVPIPGKILAIGLNYLDHIEETHAQKPEYPTYFAKMTSAANGPFDPIQLPAVSEQLDYEAELVFIIGKRCRNVPRGRAREVIFGYCAGDDVSVRDWQLRTSQWVIGKSFDTHAPFGPWITTGEEVDPHCLGIRCFVNGDRRQNSSTSNLVFDCFAQVEFLSKVMTLEPGDVIFTGTSSGVALARKPQPWLKIGDLVRVEIDRLGALENRVVAGSPDTRIG